MGLTLNDIGHVTLRVAADLAVEDYLDSRHIGSFLVIDPASGYTLAAGMVGDALEAKIDPASRPSQYSI